MEPVNFGQIISFGKKPILYEAKLDIYSPGGPKLSQIKPILQYEIKKLGLGFTSFIKITLSNGQSFSTSSYSTCVINDGRFLAITKDDLINKLTYTIKRELEFIERQKNEWNKKYNGYSDILKQIKSYEIEVAI